MDKLSARTELAKSTLLRQLTRHFTKIGQPIIEVRLTNGSRRLPFPIRHLVGMEPEKILIIDGFEQLAFWKRQLIKTIARIRGTGLLITTHKDQGLATMAKTFSNLTTLKAIIERLDCDRRLGNISDNDLCKLLDTFDGNVREVLFRLYDLVEA